MSGAGCTATQMGSLATAPGTRGGAEDGVEMGWGLRLLDVSSPHTSCNTRAVLSSSFRLSSWVQGWLWLLQSQQLSSAHQSGLWESLVWEGLELADGVAP